MNNPFKILLGLVQGKFTADDLRAASKVNRQLAKDELRQDIAELRDPETSELINDAMSASLDCAMAVTSGIVEKLNDKDFQAQAIGLVNAIHELGKSIDKAMKVMHEANACDESWDAEEQEV